MSIHQNKYGIWQISFRIPGGARIRRSAQTKNRQLAQELHDKLRHEAWTVAKLGKKPRRTWDEACVRFLGEKQHKKSLDKDKQRLRSLPELRGVFLDELDRDFIHQIVNRKNCSDSTKNRYLALIRSILRLCANDWEWIEKCPKINLHKEPKRRVRWLYPEEAQRLINELAAVPYMQHLVIFALSTGLRQRNVLDLMWEQIDLKRRVAWIYADQTKSGNALGVPLNENAMKVLSVRKEIGTSRYVFTNKGHRICYIDRKAWQRALQNAGIENFRWHDLRHTWASWQIQAGTPLPVLQEMGGWESIEMVRRYAHLAPEHLLRHASAINQNFLAPQTCPKFVQSGNFEQGNPKWQD